MPNFELCSGEQRRHGLTFDGLTLSRAGRSVIYHMREYLEREYHFSIAFRIRLSNRVRIALCSCSFTSSDMGTRLTSVHTPNTAFASFGVTQRA